MDLKHAYADVNGIRMHYVTAGQGEPVLLLHGFPEYWGVWKKVIANLSKDHQVFAPDLRGYNLTSRPAEVDAYHILKLVGDVRGLVEHLGLKKLNVVCQDWGGLVGWSFLLRHPDLVKRFVVIDITHPALFNRELRENPAQQKASAYMLLFRSPAAEAQLTANDFAFGRNAIFADARQHGAQLSDEDLEEWIQAWKQPGAWTGGLNYYRAARIGPPDGQGNPGGSNVVDDLRPEQLQVHVPVLILWAELDEYLLSSGLTGIEQLVKDVTIKKVPGANHWLSLEKPELVSQAVREFVAGRPG
jgi:epoxide hydrolase 4